MNLNVVFISSLQYPNGGASVIRNLSLYRGLIELGHNVSIILLYEQDEIDFEYKGINFIRLFNISNNRFSHKLKKKWHFLKFLKTKSILNKINNSSQLDAVVIDSYDPKILNPIMSFCKKKNIPIFQERSEYPFLVMENYKNAEKDLNYYMNYIIQQFDGMYVVSDALVEYFHNKTYGKVPIKKIVMTVEPDRFENFSSNSPFEFDYLAYCGTMYGEKDGISILIKSFGIVAEKFTNIKLVLIGDTSNKDEIQRYYSLIDSLNLKDRVIFTGRVKKDDMPNLLTNSKALCLARPNNKQAEGGFPTKLGEYLSTKRPVIVTNVGEINQYLKDNVHAFIAEPDSERSFAEKIESVLNNYDYAKKIGLQGYELTQGIFNYKVQAKELAQFFENRE